MPTIRPTAWYLSSALTTSAVDDPPAASDPVLEPVPVDGAAPVATAPDDAQMLRPEAAAYLSPAVAARAMFEPDRPGRVSGAMALAERSYADERNAWVNMHDGDHRFAVADGQAGVRGQWQSLQLGLGARLGDHWIAGFKAGRGSYDLSARSTTTGYGARGESKGSMAGGYVDFRQSLDHPDGVALSLDIAIERMRHRVQGDGLEPERYKSSDWNATLEAAYGVRFGGADGGRVLLRPNAGVSWTRPGTATHVEANGTRVDFARSAPLQGTLGVDLLAELRPGEQLQLAPYVGVQGVAQRRAAAIDMDQQTTDWEGHSRMLRLQAGVQARLSKRFHAELGLRHERGRDGYRADTFKAEVSVAF